MPVTTLRPDHYEDTAAARLAAQANYSPGETVGERDSGDIHVRTISGWLPIRLAGAALVTLAGSSGGGSLQVTTLPAGPIVSQPAQTLAATKTLLTLTHAAKGLKFTPRPSTDTASDATAEIVVDPTSPGMADMNLDTTVAGERFSFNMHDGPYEKYFDGDTIISLYHIGLGTLGTTPKFDVEVIA